MFFYFESKDSLYSARKSAINSMGVTFRVYDTDNEFKDRQWPLDIIPRIINQKDWNIVQKGLNQRTKALNLFINDVYNKQDFLKLNPVLKDLVLNSSNFLPECCGIKPKNNIT